jgi:predicted transcriptional regulator
VPKRVQVVLDEGTYRLLEELAQPRAGNKSFVVREALRYFAEREAIERALDASLASHDARSAMEAGVAAWRRGDLIPHERVVRAAPRRRKLK